MLIPNTLARQILETIPEGHIAGDVRIYVLGPDTPHTVYQLQCVPYLKIAMGGATFLRG